MYVTDQRATCGSLFFFFHHVGSGDQTYILRLVDTHLYSLSHLTSPPTELLNMSSKPNQGLINKT